MGWLGDWRQQATVLTGNTYATGLIAVPAAVTLYQLNTSLGSPRPHPHTSTHTTSQYGPALTAALTCAKNPSQRAKLLPDFKKARPCHLYMEQATSTVPGVCAPSKQGFTLHLYCWH